MERKSLKQMDVNDAFYIADESKGKRNSRNLQDEVKNMNIYEKMLKIQTELGIVAKNLNVSTGKGSYKAVSERDVIDAVKPLEDKYRVYSYPYSRAVIKDEKLENKRVVKEQEVTVTSIFMRLETKYRFVNIDNPQEYIEITTYGDGIDTGDKSTGKAMTYCDKYALLKGYKISSGEDLDAEASPSEGYRVAKSNEPKETEKVVQSDEPKATDKQKNYVAKLVGISLPLVLEKYSINSIDELTVKQASDIIREFKNNTESLGDYLRRNEVIND